MNRVGLWLAGLLMAVALAGALPAAPAAAADQHVAGVTVSFGPGQVVRRTVSFSEGSISGLDALRRAGFAIEVYGYSGIGGAVCRIDGVGRPADAACLSSRDTSYWAYWRNGGYSRLGAGATKVSDGDQEQWAWGAGTSAPPTTAFPTPTTAPPPTAASTPTPSAPGGTTGPGGSGPAGTRPVSPATTEPEPGGSTTPGASSTTRPGGSTTSIGDAPATRPASATEDDGEDEEAAGGTSPASAGDGGGGGPLALVAFGTVLLAVVGLTLKARSARGSTHPRN